MSCHVFTFLISHKHSKEKKHKRSWSQSPSPEKNKRRRSRSPRRRSKSPKRHSRSPRRHSRSPRKQSRSPKRYRSHSRSPQYKRHHSRSRSPSPFHDRKKDNEKPSTLPVEPVVGQVGFTIFSIKILYWRKYKNFIPFFTYSLMFHTGNYIYWCLALFYQHWNWNAILYSFIYSIIFSQYIS